MIDRVSFRNFKCLRAVDLNFGRMTVLVGANGSGKSSVLAGIHLLSQIGARVDDPFEESYPRLRRLFGGSSDPRRLARPGDTIHLTMQEEEADELSLTVEIDPILEEDIPPNIRFSFSVDGPQGRRQGKAPEEFDPNVLRTVAAQPLNDPRFRRFASVVYLHLDAALMAQPSPVIDEEPQMRFDGRGLASTLAWLAGREPDTLAAIAQDLARVVPGVRRILTDRKTIRETVNEAIEVEGQKIWRPVQRKLPADRFLIEFDHGPPVPADLLSEGTVLALGLLTKLREPRRPRLVLLDDIERGLHIGAQVELVKVLKALLERESDLQIICSTHSPYLLDLFEPGDVLILALDEDRATHAQPLTAHPEFERWRYGVQTGELYAALGSAWVPKLSARESP